MKTLVNVIGGLSGAVVLAGLFAPAYFVAAALVSTM